MMADEPLDTPLDAAPEAIESIPEPTLRESLAEGMREIVERDDAPARERDESGRFKSKAGEPAADVVAEPNPNASLTEAAPFEPPTPAIDPAPQSLSAEARAKWAEVPPEVRADIAKREREVAQMVGRQDNERTFGRAINDVVAPYAAMMRANNTHPIELFTRMLNTEHTLMTGDANAKARMLAQAAQQYGIDMDLAYQFKGEPIAAPAPPPAPPIDIEARVNAAIEQRETAREIAEFAATHEHFETVRPHIAALLENNLATTLTDAYDQAIHARPELRSTLIASEVAKAAAKQSAFQRTAQAKLAAVSLPGSSGSSRPTGYSNETSLRDELRSRYRELNSGSV